MGKFAITKAKRNEATDFINGQYFPLSDLNGAGYDRPEQIVDGETVPAEHKQELRSEYQIIRESLHKLLSVVPHANPVSISGSFETGENGSAELSLSFVVHEAEKPVAVEVAVEPEKVEPAAEVKTVETPQAEEVEKPIEEDGSATQ